MEQWKVLIADDEMIIREGIREVVDWESIHLNVVDEAEDGEEALELAMHYEIDILLADLNMPIMNGLTLIKAIRKQLPNCKIVIITGHDEFRYAQEALRLNVTDYIMKPVEPDQLTEVLEKVSLQLEKEQNKKKQMDLASKHIEKNIPLFREHFFMDWIKGRMTHENILAQLEFLHLPKRLPKQLGIIRWADMEKNNSLLTEKEREETLYAAENIIRKQLFEYTHVVFRQEQDLIVTVLWEEVAEQILLNIESMIQINVKIVTNQHFENLSEDNSMITAYKRCKEFVCSKVEVSYIVRRAKQYISEHYSDSNLSLESVADSLRVSSVYLSRMIKQELGISFIRLLTKLRIKKAVELLNTTNMTIHEVSVQVGYETQHYFSTAFKKVMGVSPKQYRQGSAFKKV
ncbi:response regulator [Alkalihalobacillus sp. LMS39]|uniref:response regulator transcription factor n=1 Tax=Alkalihalobacillus sp. LMS39 TaxID=2924032 RepID=UPI001FB4830B|nr:response regulator [Alkalihalobacillus sp. LMS39]UOE92713.1 response regulator [Alkalihalobacillus sp. LMS39]